MRRFAPFLLPFLMAGSAFAQPGSAGENGPPGNRYKLSGSRDLMPTALGDDGSKTYIEWAPERPLPAVFSIDALGHEEMVNGYMRDGIFTIDRVYDRLKFRIDKAELTARRLQPEAGK